MHPDAGSADSSPLVRAAIARYAVGSNTIDEAIYWHAARTSRDAALHSSRNYVVHFSGEPDVSEFWSLTLYDEEDKLSRNPAEHYSLSNGIPLRRNAEGSFDIVVSRDAPSEKPTGCQPRPRETSACYCVTTGHRVRYWMRRRPQRCPRSHNSMGRHDEQHLQAVEASVTHPDQLRIDDEPVGPCLSEWFDFSHPEHASAKHRCLEQVLPYA
ncbi:MAG: DUF1214 domain-containing protein [Gammaproteobacteria bacterium]|nr:DUF1214 domain-containing protein [Gammaproteobacteria bacterium]